MKKLKGILLIVLIVVLIVVVALIASKVVKGFAQKVDINLSEVQVGNVAFANDNVSIELDENIKVRANIPIFMYHWIKDDTGDYPYPENMVKPSELRKQMEYLNENNYDVIFVSEIGSAQHYDKPVILTFDDGWEDVYIHAFPLAKELNMKFCMYVIMDLIGEPGYCSMEQLQEMRDSGLVEIDSHTLSHPRLAEVSVTQATSELIDSKAQLLEKLNIDSTVICYPYGSCNANVLKIARENYTYGLLMDGGVFRYNSNLSDMLAIERIYAMRSMSIDTFKNYCVQSYVSVE